MARTNVLTTAKRIRRHLGVGYRQEQSSLPTAIDNAVTSFSLSPFPTGIQPGVTLGFRKSFERNHDQFKTKIAELTLVASKHLGKNAAIHLGGVFWDASLEGNFDDDAIDGRTEVTLHGFKDAKKKQLRPFGGIELRPLPSSQILVDIGWAPEFCYQCSNFGDQANGAQFGANKIRLKPVLSWGVRNQLATWARIEAGVRLPDIGEANLLDAQIFGQVTFTSSALRGAVESLQ